MPRYTRATIAATALGQWIASLRVGDTLTVDDIHRFMRVELALRNADKHHQQARAMTAERDEWRDAAKWSEGQHQHWKTVAEAATAQRDEARRLHMVVRNELGTLRAKLDAAVKTIQSDYAEWFICLAHPHNNRLEEALCSAKYQLDAVVRELHNARLNSEIVAEVNRRFDAECTTLRARLAACERVVGAACTWADAKRHEYELLGQRCCGAAHPLIHAVIAYRAAKMQEENNA